MSYQNSSEHYFNLAKSRRKANEKINCEFCGNSFTKANSTKHERACSHNPKNIQTCPVCKKRSAFKGKTCSHGCANTYFRTGKNHGNWLDSAYRTTCFLYHAKECAVCGEHNIVEVHHLDGNPKNNDPRNLIPLCPTHHQYWHSRFKSLIVKKIELYVKKWSEQQDSNL